MLDSILVCLAVVVVLWLASVSSLLALALCVGAALVPLLVPR